MVPDPSHHSETPPFSKVTLQYFLLKGTGLLLDIGLGLATYFGQ